MLEPDYHDAMRRRLLIVAGVCWFVAGVFVVVWLCLR